MHTWDRQHGLLWHRHILGTTHAHAGQTRSKKLNCEILEEPPMHTRGRHWEGSTDQENPGTIHAHAGQTPYNTGYAVRCRNHPCTRGADAC